MTDTKHTPWKVVIDASCFVVLDAGGITPIAVQSGPGAEERANLIAAAPELHEACELALAALRALDHLAEHASVEEIHSAAEGTRKLKAALAKAKGE